MARKITPAVDPVPTGDVLIVASATEETPPVVANVATADVSPGA